MIKFVSGNMFDDSSAIRVNTVNCVGKMGKGVALAFKTRYPKMFGAYQKACKEGKVKPGHIYTWRDKDVFVLNFPTKRHWRDDSRYEDIESGLDALRRYLAPLGRVKISIPALGCGHGGLSWFRVRQMIEAKLAGLDAEILVYSPGDSTTIK